MPARHGPCGKDVCLSGAGILWQQVFYQDHSERTGGRNAQHPEGLSPGSTVNQLLRSVCIMNLKADIFVWRLFSGND